MGGDIVRVCFKEGFADYTGAIGRQQPNEWERLKYTTGIPGKIEGHVAALFTDLIDSSDEGDDETNYPGYYVSEVFRPAASTVRSATMCRTSCGV